MTEEAKQPEEVMSDMHFAVGNKAIDEALEESKRKQEEFNKNNAFIRDFWISAGDGGEETSANVRFLTKEPIVISTHNFYFDGRWRSYTCVGDPTTCPMCLCPEAKISETRREGAHLVIDRREFKNKETGVVYKDEIKVGTWAASHIADFNKDAAESEDKVLTREWKMTRSGQKAKTKYRLYPKKTDEIPAEDKAKYKEVLSKFIPEWRAFVERRKLDPKDFSLNRFVVAKSVAPLPIKKLEEIVAEYLGRLEKPEGSSGGSEKASPEKAADSQPVADDDEAYDF